MPRGGDVSSKMRNEDLSPHSHPPPTKLDPLHLLLLSRRKKDFRLNGSETVLVLLALKTPTELW